MLSRACRPCQFGAMKVLIFGTTGMVGQGVLREWLRDTAIERVATVGRAMIVVVRGG